MIPNGNAGVAEQADATDLKSVDTMYRAGSSPALGTRIKWVICIDHIKQAYKLRGGAVW